MFIKFKLDYKFRDREKDDMIFKDSLLDAY